MIRAAFLAAFITVLSAAARDAQAGLLLRWWAPRFASCPTVQSCRIGCGHDSASNCCPAAESVCEPFRCEDDCCTDEDCDDHDCGSDSEGCWDPDCCCDCELCCVGCCCKLDRGSGHGGVTNGTRGAGHHGRGIWGQTNRPSSGFPYASGRGRFGGRGAGGGGYGGGDFPSPIYSDSGYLPDGPGGGGPGADEPSGAEDHPPVFPPDLPTDGAGVGPGPDGDTPDNPASTHAPEPGTAAIWVGLWLSTLLWAARRRRQREPAPRPRT